MWTKTYLYNGQRIGQTAFHTFYILSIPAISDVPHKTLKAAKATIDRFATYEEVYSA